MILSTFFIQIKIEIYYHYLVNYNCISQYKLNQESIINHECSR